jgi:hypothetical protein
MATTIEAMCIYVLQVWEEQRILVKENGGFVAQLKCTNNAPKGDCFYAIVQLFGCFKGCTQSRLRVSMRVRKSGSRCFTLERKTAPSCVHCTREFTHGCYTKVMGLCSGLPFSDALSFCIICCNSKA